MAQREWIVETAEQVEVESRKKYIHKYLPDN
jgi:hypothetical protein